MVRLFNHWFPSNTVLQVAFDAILLFVAFMLATLWLNRGNPSQLELQLPVAILFAVAVVGVNSLIGLYQRDPYRTGIPMAARVMLSLLLSLTVGSGVLRFLPWSDMHEDVLKLAALGALGVLFLVRGYLTHWGRSPMFVRRVLVRKTAMEMEPRVQTPKRQIMADKQTMAIALTSKTARACLQMVGRRI